VADHRHPRLLLNTRNEALAAPGTITSIQSAMPASM